MKGAEAVNWNKDKSILLSQICTALFALLLAALDIGCYWAVHWFIRLRNMNWQKGIAFMVTIYLCSVFAWLLLYGLWKLLGNMKSGRVFVEENVRRLRMVSFVRGKLLDFGALGAVMTGTGSAVFGVFREREPAELACRELQKEFGFCCVSEAVGRLL